MSTTAFSDGTLTDGCGLAEVLGATEADSPSILIDQNGEEFRANEWGHALIRASPQCPQLKTAEWSPRSLAATRVWRSRVWPLASR